MTKSEKAKVAVAGMDLNRDLPVGMIRVPRPIILSGESLLWGKYAKGDRQAIRLVQPPTGLLEKFVSLTSSLDIGIKGVDHKVLKKAETKGSPKILQFAQNWGVLEICQHLLPASHDEQCRPMTTADDEHQYREPISAWYSYVSLFQSIIRIASKVHQGHTGSHLDWTYISQHPRFKNVQHLQTRSYDLAVHRDRLSLIVNLLISDARVKPVLQFNSDKFEVKFRGGWSIVCGLFGHLAIELMSAVAAEPRIHICSACGRSYVPKRRPHANRKNYCRRKSCCKKTRWRIAKRQQRNKDRVAATPPSKSN